MDSKSDELLSSAVKFRIAEYARAHLGAHYLLGAAGATPGKKDGVGYRSGGVKLHANATTGDRTDHSRTRPILFTATYTSNELHVCAGRCEAGAVKILPKGDPGNSVNTLQPELSRWERPYRKMDSGESVFGESCVGIRHFDCIGFVNFVMGRVQERQWNIASWIKHTEEVAFTDVMAGDILTKSGHIGFATSSSQVIHASDTQYGVIETSISKGSWTRCGRMKTSFWLCYELTPGPIDFTFEEVENYA